MHAPLCEVGAYVPAAHGACSVLPVGLKKPGSVTVHSSTLVRLVASEYVPSSHGSAAAAPSKQYEPATHILHAVSPAPDWNLPASHLAHEAIPSSAVIVPGAQ